MRVQWPNKRREPFENSDELRATKTNSNPTQLWFKWEKPKLQSIGCPWSDRMGRIDPNICAQIKRTEAKWLSCNKWPNHTWSVCAYVCACERKKWLYKIEHQLRLYYKMRSQKFKLKEEIKRTRTRTNHTNSKHQLAVQWPYQHRVILNVYEKATEQCLLFFYSSLVSEQKKYACDTLPRMR